MPNMPKEAISASQAVCVLILFLFGSNALFNIDAHTAQDSWISLLFALIYALPVLMIYARLMKLFPEKDLFEIIKLLFGKVTGKVLVALMTWYALHLAALVLRNFSEFIRISVMFQTPQIVIMIIMMLLVVYMTKSGIETMGRWSIFMMPFILTISLLTVILSINKIDIGNIYPIMEHGLGTIAAHAFEFFSFPYAETVVFLCLAGCYKRKESPYKLYVYSALTGTAILLLVMLRNILLLGIPMGIADYFPSFTAVSILDIGGFLAHIEGSTATNLILAGIIKITVCLAAATKGMASLFGIQNYKNIVFPLAVLTIALGFVIYRSTLEMINFLDLYPYYAIPFQLAIPILVWVVGEIKVRKMRKKETKEISS